MSFHDFVPVIITYRHIWEQWKAFKLNNSRSFFFSCHAPVMLGKMFSGLSSVLIETWRRTVIVSLSLLGEYALDIKEVLKKNEPFWWSYTIILCRDWLRTEGFSLSACDQVNYAKGALKLGHDFSDILFRRRCPSRQCITLMVASLWSW